MQTRTVSTLKHTVTAVALLLLGTFTNVVLARDVMVTLTGDQEVPPVTTAAKGSGTVTIGDDMSVKGSITTTGIAGTAAHIHLGAPDKSGPVIVPMIKNGDNGWTFAPGAKLTGDQMKAFQAGDLYINVHSAAHPPGEIRGNLKP